MLPPGCKSISFVVRRKVRAPQGMMPGNTRAWPFNRSGQKVQQKAYCPAI